MYVDSTTAINQANHVYFHFLYTVTPLKLIIYLVDNINE